MALEDDFTRMEAHFGLFQQHLEGLQRRLPPSDPSAAQVRGLRELLQKEFGKFVAMFHEENLRLDEERARREARLEALEKEALAGEAARVQERAEREARRAAAQQPETSLDPTLGARLRALILKDLEDAAQGPAEPRPDDPGEVATMHSGDWKADAASTPPPPQGATPKPAPQPRKPPAGSESFEWESTDGWEQKGM